MGKGSSMEDVVKKYTKKCKTFGSMKLHGSGRYVEKCLSCGESDKTILMYEECRMVGAKALSAKDMEVLLSKGIN